jgi:hypothetical protein
MQSSVSVKVFRNITSQILDTLFIAWPNEHTIKLIAGWDSLPLDTMRQVIQNIRTGKLNVTTIPDPLVRPGYVLIANAASVISAGTEKTSMALARKSLLGKARERPDQVRRVLEKLRNEGFFQTFALVREGSTNRKSMGNSSRMSCLGDGVKPLSPRSVAVTAHAAWFAFQNISVPPFRKGAFE